MAEQTTACESVEQSSRRASLAEYSRLIREAGGRVDAPKVREYRERFAGDVMLQNKMNLIDDIWSLNAHSCSPAVSGV